MRNFLSRTITIVIILSIFSILLTSCASYEISSKEIECKGTIENIVQTRQYDNEKIRTTFIIETPVGSITLTTPDLASHSYSIGDIVLISSTKYTKINLKTNTIEEVFLETVYMDKNLKFNVTVPQSKLLELN